MLRILSAYRGFCQNHVHDDSASLQAPESFAFREPPVKYPEPCNESRPGIGVGMTQQSDNDDAPDTWVPTADEKAKRLRQIGDANAVYGEIGQNDEQLDVNQPEEDEHV
jgi:hypothetical protein